MLDPGSSPAAGRSSFASAPTGRPRTRYDRIRHPSSGLGPGIRSRLCCDVPDLFRVLPKRTRAEVVRRHLGPSSPWHLKPKFDANVEAVLGRDIRRADPVGDRIRLELVGDDGTLTTVEADHVICATGYRADLSRLTFIDPALRAKIRTVNRAPALGLAFDSSVPGLSFAGIAAAMTFGPLMRFMHGDEFAARRISGHIARRTR